MPTKKSSKKTTAQETAPVEEQAAATAVEPTMDQPAANEIKAGSPVEQPIDPSQEQAHYLSQLQMVADSQPAAQKPIQVGRFRTRQPNAVHTSDGATTAMDQETIQRNQWAIQLYQSLLNHTPMVGEVKSVQPAFDRAEVAADKMRYMVTVQAGPYVVYIPDDQFADIDYNKFANDTQKPLSQAIKMYLESRIGAKIDYVVTQVPQRGQLNEVGFVGGSRKEAMVRKRARFWYGTQANGSAYVKQGDMCRVRVISVSAKAIRVELFGAETPVIHRDLDYALIADCRNVFSPGMELDAVITKIERADLDVAGGQNFPVEFQVSVKEAKQDPRDLAMKLYSEGSRVKGVVNFIRIPTDQNPDARPAVFVQLQEGVQVQCPFPNGTIPPRIGAEANVTITNVNREKKYLFGTITHFQA